MSPPEIFGSKQDLFVNFQRIMMVCEPRNIHEEMPVCNQVK